MYSKALSIRPPSHPLLSAVSQSMSSCSDRDTSLPVRMALMPSTDTTVEKAQQLPHLPWSLTPVTAPFCRQSTDCGRSSALTLPYMNPGMAGATGPSRRRSLTRDPAKVARNSSRFMSPKRLRRRR
uniref:Uncharacterized protein n=1 Tax=Avena sativa TaxID=4498 RepID=A0ACD5WN40_AVESA